MGVKFVDTFSLLHFASGIIAYYFNLDWWLWLLLHILFELVENTKMGIAFINDYFGWFWPGGKDKPDAIINRVGDVVFGMIGWIVAMIVNEKF